MWNSRCKLSIFFAALFASNINAQALMGSIERLAGNETGGSYAPMLSSDGGQLVFLSTSTTLISGTVETDSAQDVFIKNITNNTIERITPPPSNGEFPQSTYSAVFSPDGTKVAFISHANYLVQDKMSRPGITQVYIKHLSGPQAGNISVVSETASGEIANNDCWGAPVFSQDSSRVAFCSNASNFGSGIWQENVYIKNLNDNSITLVSRVGLNGEVGNSNSCNPAFSPDGTQIAFHSSASNLVTDDFNGVSDIFIKELTGPTAGSIQLISRIGTAGDSGNDGSYEPIFSVDGEKIAFTSAATNFAVANYPPVDHNQIRPVQVFVKSLLGLNAGAITLVSQQGGNGLIVGDASSYGQIFSPDGNEIAFQSSATNLVSGAIKIHAFIKDLLSNEVAVITTNTSGGAVNDAGFTTHFLQMVFSSDATNLVIGDTDGQADIFLWKRDAIFKTGFDK